MNEQELSEKELKRLSRRSLLWSGAYIAGGLVGLSAFNKRASDDGTGIKKVFRSAHLLNEQVARTIFYSPARLAPEFPRAQAVTPRNNYNGATPEVDLAAWRLDLAGQPLTLDDLKQLPEVSQTTELKCVEGWSAVVNWSGARFVDLVKKYPMPEGTRFVALRSEPPGFENDWYYVGLDIESALHPQTLLAWAMNGEALTPEHGAPLRLVIPHKYGIKNIKLITQITFESTRPADYWAERGYDWYAGL